MAISGYASDQTTAYRVARKHSLHSFAFATFYTSAREVHVVILGVLQLQTGIVFLVVIDQHLPRKRNPFTPKSSMSASRV